MDLWGRTKALIRLGYDLDLIVTTKEQPLAEDIAVVRALTHRLELVKRASNWKGLLSRQPIQFISRRGLSSHALKEEYDIVLLETENVAPILSNPSLRTKKVILRVQNDECEYLRQLCKSTSSPFKKLYYAEEARRYQYLSQRLFETVDALWFISDDLCSKQPATWKNKSFVLPGSLELDQFREPSLESTQVLFVGTLSVPTNQEGLLWYLNYIHPALLDIPGYRLVVAGNTRGQDLKSFLGDIASRSSVEVHTDVVDLTGLYLKSRVFINPMLRGTSVKMKTLNAAEHGLPIVTTTVGNEGTGLVSGQHLVVADEPPTFCAAVRRLLLTNDGITMVREAHQFLEERYDCAREISRLLSAI